MILKECVRELDQRRLGMKFFSMMYSIFFSPSWKWAEKGIDIHRSEAMNRYDLIISMTNQIEAWCKIFSRSGNKLAMSLLWSSLLVFKSGWTKQLFEKRPHAEAIKYNTTKLLLIECNQAQNQREVKILFIWSQLFWIFNQVRFDPIHYNQSLRIVDWD